MCAYGKGLAGWLADDKHSCINLASRRKDQVLRFSHELMEENLAS